jgi:excisionase family DNA binding protein
MWTTRVCITYTAAILVMVKRQGCVKLNLKQAAQRVGVSARQIRELIEQGELPAEKPGKTWQIEVEDLMRVAHFPAANSTALEQERIIQELTARLARMESWRREIVDPVLTNKAPPEPEIKRNQHQMALFLGEHGFAVQTVEYWRDLPLDSQSEALLFGLERLRAQPGRYHNTPRLYRCTTRPDCACHILIPPNGLTQESGFRLPPESA